MIEASEGKRYPVDMSFELGEMAVTRVLSQEHLWTITHKPTSFRIPFNFPSSIAAEVALRELENVVGWADLHESIAEGIQPDDISKIIRVCEQNGGKSYRSARAQPALLRRRLGRHASKATAREE